jgi:hypothetical protein
VTVDAQLLLREGIPRCHEAGHEGERDDGYRQRSGHHRHIVRFLSGKRLEIGVGSADSGSTCR